MQYRITREEGFSNSGLWYAEEKTSFGWEKVIGTFGANAEESQYLLKQQRKDA